MFRAASAALFFDGQDRFLDHGDSLTANNSVIPTEASKASAVEEPAGSE
jgi:hypothetical protein